MAPPTVTAELVGRAGRLPAVTQANEHGLVLTARVVVDGRPVARVTACALTGSDGKTLGVVTDTGHVYALHLAQQRRFTLLDVLPAPGTAAAFMARLSRRLFVGCRDGSLHCFDVGSSTCLAQLPGHRAAIGSLSCRPDCEQLVSASSDAVLLWDVAAFRQRRVLGAVPHGCSQAVFSPSGALIAVTAPGSGRIAIWDARGQGCEAATLHAPLGAGQRAFAFSSLSISPDEALLVAGCCSPALLLVYDLPGPGRPAAGLRHALQMPGGFGVQQVQVLPDSASLAVLTSDGRISFIDLARAAVTGQLQLTVPGCRALSFSTDARAGAMAVVCSDGAVRLFDLATVRAQQQQRAGSSVPLQCLHEAELQLLPATTGVPDDEGKAPTLREVGNIPSATARRGGKGASKRKGASASDSSDALSARQLGGAAAALNRHKLQEILAAFGEFPARHRRLIWEHLLQLPRNAQAHALLQDRGVHAAFSSLPQRLPGGSSLGVRLQACLSQLANWCPLFGEVGFLPAFAFPFVRLFGSSSLAAFEALATLLTNWCRGWFEAFPNPPLQLLHRFLLLVSHHDAQLGAHLRALGVPLLDALWAAMSSALSDLLPAASDFVLVWDHCLAQPPSFFNAMLAAHLIGLRQPLLHAADGAALLRLFAARPAVDVRKVIKRAHALHAATPDHMRLGSASLEPLPPGAHYGVFTDYPAGSVDDAARERRAIQEAEEALIRRRQLVAELEARSQRVTHDAACLTSQRQQLAALDSQRRAALRGVEGALLAAGARLDDRAKAERLRQIRVTEEAYSASVAALRSEWGAELAALKADVDHRRSVAAAQLKSRQEDEDIKALEFQSSQRVLALQQDNLLAAGASKLRDAAAVQAGALAAQLQAKTAAWQAEDDARALTLQHELARKARLAAAAEQRAALQAAKGLLLAQELQAQQELAQVERQRALRQLAEDQATLTAQHLQAQAEQQLDAAAAAVTPQAPRQAARAAALVAAECEAVQQQLARLREAAAAGPISAPAAKLSEAQHQAAAAQHAYKEQSGAVASLLAKLQLQHAKGSPAKAGSQVPGLQAAQLDAAAAQQLPRKTSTRQQQHHDAHSSAAPGSPAPQPTPHSISSGSSGVSPSSSSLPSVSADLEQLLAETEAEVQRELAVARGHLTGASRQHSGGRLQPVLEEPLAYAGAAVSTADDDHGAAGDGGSPRGSGASSKPSSLSFDLPAAAAASLPTSSIASPDGGSLPTPMLGGSRRRARTGTAAVEPAESEPDEDDVSGGGAAWSERGGSGGGSLSAELHRSSSATSEELEDLLQQLSAYEQHLLGASGTPSTGQPGGERAASSRADSLAGSVSWSQTISALPEGLRPLSASAGSAR